MKRLIFFSFAIVALLASCRSHKNLERSDNTVDKPATNTATTPALDFVRNVDFKYYTANFSCEVEGIAVSGQIRIARDSMIWISVNKFIEVGRVVITPDSVKGFARVVNKYFTGSFADLKQRFGLDLDYASLQALLLGNLPPRCLSSGKPERSGDMVRLAFKQGQRQVSLSKTAASNLIATIEMLSSSPRQLIKIDYKNRRSVAAQPVPDRLDVRLECKLRNVSTLFALDDIVLNKRQTYPFAIPKRFNRL